MLQLSRFLGSFAFVAVVLGQSRPAAAYSYGSAIATGCHERLAASAIRDVRSAFSTAPVIAPSRNERALIDDVPFVVASDLKDLAGASLLIGVRDNDLHGRGPTEIDSLARIHGDPSLQREHCLRGPELDEPVGTRLALEECKTFIREKVNAALDGLAANGAPDPKRRVDLPITLSLRGRVTASLPAFWIEIGRAMHALEDSFSHTFRAPDHEHVRVTANWVEDADGTLVERRDGPAHRGEMDECDDLDAYRAANFSNANQASIDLLRDVLDPALATREQKLAAVDATLDKYLTYEPGCTFENAWCNAPENNYKVAASACSIAPGRTSGFAALAIGLIAIAFVARRRRALSIVALVLVTPSVAHADEAPPDVSPEQAPVGTPTKQEVKAEQKNIEHRLSHFALYAAGSGSISNESLNGQLGGRYRISERWMVGLDGEINGWFGLNAGRFAAGAFNGYGTVVFRTPLRFADFNLRSTANLGVSVLLVDLYGAPSGSTGIFLGLTPLGLEWKVSSSVFIVLDAIGVALPIPQLSGAPFAYPQYRAAIGVELSL